MSESGLEDIIAAEQRGWDDCVVDRLVFGTDSPAAIAEHLERFCEAELGSRVARGLFYRVSVGCVAGLGLADGRRVVVKAQRGERRREYLDACLAFRRLLASEGFPCPRPLTEAVRAGGAWVTAEELCEAGAPGDAHEPEIRRAIVQSLATLVEASARFSSGEALGRAWFMGLPDGRALPRPHSPFFDFDKTESGAEWITALAGEARERRKSASGARAVGHFDYRVEHLRFEGGRVVASYDWDSLHFEMVPVLVGALAPHFTADWQRDDLVRAPSIDEMRAFVGDFEASRGQAFSGGERETLAASCVFAMAYTARCNHAANPQEEGWNGDLRPMLRRYGREILDRGL